LKAATSFSPEIVTVTYDTAPLTVINGLIVGVGVLDFSGTT
jgi:hypothetical protein